MSFSYSSASSPLIPGISFPKHADLNGYWLGNDSRNRRWSYAGPEVIKGVLGRLCSNTFGTQCVMEELLLDD